jgi:phosphatidylglycerol:prolipoprotein diacylglycerol transferase
MIALPYVPTPRVPIDLPILGVHELTPFGPLLLVGVLVGLRCCRKLAALRGLPREQLDSLTTAVLVLGFAMAHWVSLIFYYPDQVIARPWSLLVFTSGLSSVGGFVGGTLAFAWICRRRKLDPRQWADVLAFGLLAGFTIGRIGCSIVHDHPGALSDSWLAVGPWPDGTHRFDLGLVEACVLATICAVVYLRMDMTRLAPGRFTAGLAIVYGTGRFFLDFARADDLRYAGLTTAQLACLAFIAAGALLWRRSSPASRVGAASCRLAGAPCRCRRRDRAR